MKIEPLQDWRRLKKIRLEALAEAPDAFGSTHERALSYDDDNWRQQTKDLPTFVAVLNNIDVGMVRGTAADEDERSAYLISMWVAPEARGQGAGERLIQSIVEWARAEKFDRLRLDVADENASAIALYQRVGFRPTAKVGSLPAPRQHILEHQQELLL